MTLEEAKEAIYLGLCSGCEFDTDMDGCSLTPGEDICEPHKIEAAKVIIADLEQQLKAEKEKNHGRT